MPLLTREKQRSYVALPKLTNIETVTQNYEENAVISNKSSSVIGACLKCANPRCIKYTEALIKCEEFEDFSYERNLSVCPVDAIRWNYSLELPEIDDKKCLKCGLCALRCPTGAITIKNRRMHVNPPDDSYQILPATSENLHRQEAVFEGLMALNWKHRFVKESDTIMESVYDKVARFDGRSMAANLLVRNLMIALGYHCSISRAGDVYTRIDAVYSNGDDIDSCYGAIEIEFGKDTLDASRGILDDIAVLHSRNGIDKNKNTALVICLSFPNKRQGYFQVIKDISNVLNLKIQTLSLGALLILAWNDIEIGFSQRQFYVDFDNLSIRGVTDSELGRRNNISNGFLGILEPEK